VPPLADAGAPVENRAPGVDRDRQGDQGKQRREDEEDRGGDEDVETAQDGVDRPRVTFARGRDEFFETGLGLG
jgi:hypothetical protein